MSQRTCPKCGATDDGINKVFEVKLDPDSFCPILTCLKCKESGPRELFIEDFGLDIKPRKRMRTYRQWRDQKEF